VEQEKTANQPDETLTFPDGTASLRRNVKFMVGAEEIGVGDHMIVKLPATGRQDDVVVIQEGGKQRVKRRMVRMRIKSGSGAVPASTTFSSFLEDLEAGTEERLLEIYKMFRQPSEKV